MNRLPLIVMALAVLIASCTGVPNPDGYDWCYTYDYTTSQANVNLVRGTWVNGVGLVSDGANVLQFNGTHGSTVSPTLAIITVAHDDTPTDLLVNASGTIYGISSTITGASFPGALTTAITYFEPSSGGVSGWNYNISIIGSDGIVVQSIEVRGRGASPFPSNPCSTLPTNTPDLTLPFPGPTHTDIPTNTPIATDTPSQTPTNTLTPTNTATPQFEWCHNFDFTASDGGWAAVSGNQATYTAGVGWEDVLVYATSNPNRPRRQILIEDTFSSASVNKISVVFSRTLGDTAIVSATGIWSASFGSNLFNGSTSTTSPMVWTGSETLTGISISIAVSGHDSNPADPGGTGVITSVRVEGTGSNPYGSDNCNLPTATPTYTFTPTDTLTPSNTPTPMPSTTPRTATRTPVQPFTRTPVNTPTGTLSPVPSQTLTPTDTRTLLAPPTSWLTQLATDMALTGTPGPSEEDVGELLILDSIGNFFSFVGNAISDFWSFLGNIPAYISGLVTNIGSMIYNLVAGLIQGINAVLGLLALLIEIGRLVIDLIVRLVSLAVGYLTQGITMTGELLSTVYNAPPVAIPGLPTCNSNPTAHDICAIYYILDWTLLAPNTPGQYIKIALAILLALPIVGLVLQRIRLLIMQVRGVTNVG